MRKIFIVWIVGFLILISGSSAFGGNARIGAVNLLFGGLDGNVTFGVSETITLGPAFSYFNRTSGNQKSAAQMLGVRLNYFPVYLPIDDGWYLGLEWLTGSVRAENTFYNASGSGAASTSSAIVGYQWMYDSGFNMNVGGGWGTANIDNFKITDSNGTTYDSGLQFSGARLEFDIGYVF